DGAVRIFVFDVQTAPLETSTADVGSTPSYAAMPPAAFVAEANLQTHEPGSDAPATLAYTACVRVPAVDAAESLRTRAHPDGAEMFIRRDLGRPRGIPEVSSLYRRTDFPRTRYSSRSPIGGRGSPIQGGATPQSGVRPQDVSRRRRGAGGLLRPRTRDRTLRTA